MTGMDGDDIARAREKQDLEHLSAAYRARFGAEPPVFFMSDALAAAVLREALLRGEPAPPEAWPHPGCNCG